MKLEGIRAMAFAVAFDSKDKKHLMQASDFTRCCHSIDPDLGKEGVS